jgi:cytochrome c556
MHTLKRLSVAMLLGAMGASAWAADDVQPQEVEAARKVVQEFAGKLGGVLKQQLEAGGPEMAISVCKQVAPALAAEYSRDGRLVKRVSLKPRNQTLGTPDVWEAQVLREFDRGVSEGKAAAEMEHAAVIEDADGRWFRYMKPIPVQPMCLQCHGQQEQIGANVKALLAKEYPDDRATGYGVGMIRGAFSIRQRLQ